MTNPLASTDAAAALAAPSPDALAAAVHIAYAHAIGGSSVDRGGDYRKWPCPGDLTSWANEVTGWVGWALTGPWGLSAATARQACAALADMLEKARPAATVEIRRLVQDGYTVVIIAVVHPDAETALAAVVSPQAAAARFAAEFDPLEAP